MNRPGIELTLSGVTKVYPGAIALEDVSMSIRGGEVVGLIGENGAGKSTLMKTLGGTITPEEGTILVDGSHITDMTPSRAAELGIAFVHQELNPFDNLDVAANVLLGRELRKGPLRFLDRKAMAAQVQPILDLLGARFKPNDPAANLSLADQQLLEIARALSMNARLVILDEPTSSLTIAETNQLLDVIRQLRDDGVAVLFITHRLHEIEAVADRVICLRDGRNAGELPREQIEKDRMVRMMIGRDISRFYDRHAHEPGPAALELRALRTTAYPNVEVSLTLHKGEILGLAGLVGAGRTELARAIFGIDPVLGGEILIGETALSGHTAKEAIAAGVSLVPEDRKGQGLLLDFGIDHNISLPGLERMTSTIFVNLAAERALAETSKKRLGIKASDMRRAAAELSGGNQQKVVLAKWLEMQPSVFIFDEPTRGIDVGAKSEVYGLMQDLADKGGAVLMISSDMEEVIGVADRVAVMCRGRIAGMVERADMTEENILRLAVE